MPQVDQIARLQNELQRADKIREYLRCNGRFGMGLGYTLVGANIFEALNRVPDQLNVCSKCPIKDLCFAAVRKRLNDDPIMVRKATKSNIMYGYQLRTRDMVNHHGPFV